jgi:hypothetical protein
LARELKPRDQLGAELLLAGHAVGYQITEALAYCYLGSKQLAHASLEVENLKGGRRRVTEEEEIFFAREDAAEQILKDLGVTQQRSEESMKRLAEQVPVLTYSNALYSTRPATLTAASRMVNEVLRTARTRVVGESSGFPLIVSRIKPTAGGAALSFKRTTYPWQDISCHDSNRISSIDYSGSIARVSYQRDCKAVGPIVQKTHQEPDITVAAADAKKAKVGAQVVVVVDEGGDGAISKMWWPGKATHPQIVQGVSLHP